MPTAAQKNKESAPGKYPRGGALNCRNPDRLQWVAAVFVSRAREGLYESPTWTLAAYLLRFSALAPGARRSPTFLEVFYHLIENFAFSVKCE